MSRNNQPRLGPLFGFLLLMAPSWSAEGAEGGSSLYLPGAAGDIVMAISPEPGFQAANGVFVQVGSVDTAVLQGRVDIGLDLDLVLDFVGASYTFDVPAIGATYTLGATIPFGYAKLDADATGPMGRTAGLSEDTFNLADIALVPLQLNWTLGDFHFKLAETIFAPAGDYDLEDRVNLGRNYWAFDTTGAITWLSTDTGTDLSMQPGILINTRNEETDYTTGAEFHVDFAVNQFLSETFALGIRGYYYRQITGDSGSGALLGDFKSESLGLGPGFFWRPKFADGRLSIIGKWMRDIFATNRFESDYGTIGAAWKF